MDELEIWMKDLNIGDNDMKIIQTALTHSSYKGMGHNVEDNERLEFLGDSVLNLIVAQRLYTPKTLSEGKMTKERAKLVNNNRLAKLFDKLKMEEFVKTAIKFKITKKVKAGFFEALFGAVFSDKGFEKCCELWDVIKKK